MHEDRINARLQGHNRRVERKSLRAQLVLVAIVIGLALIGSAKW